MYVPTYILNTQNTTERLYRFSKRIYCIIFHRNLVLIHFVRVRLLRVKTLHKLCVLVLHNILVFYDISYTPLNYIGIRGERNSVARF